MTDSQNTHIDDVLNRSSSSLEKNKALILGFSGLVVVALIAGFVYQNQSNKNRLAMENQYFEVMTEIEKNFEDYIKAKVEPKAEKPDVLNEELQKAQFKVVDLNAAYGDSLTKLSKLADDKWVGLKAVIALNDIYFRHSDFEKSKTLLETELKKKHSPSDRAWLKYQLAFSLESLGQFEQAITQLQDVKGQKDLGVRADALMALARNLKNSGNKDAAKAQYKQVIQEYPSTIFETNAKALLLHF